MEGKEQAGAVLDIDSKAWEKMFFDEKYTAHAGADFGMNLTETDPTEQEARRVPLEMFYKGMGLVGLVYGNGGELIFYDAALIAPIADAMQELHNTDDFKETLRACLLAGFMRGCQDRWELTDDFKAVCKEEINCPRLLSLFDYEPAVLQNMRQQIEFSSDNALEYYISHLLYMSKQRG